MDNPYFQRQTQRHSDCQIDYMIQTKYNSLHLCEIKFSKEIIGIDVINEAKQKIDRLGCKKNFSIWRALIHVNGVTESITDSGFFSHLIDFSQLLKQE